MMERFDRAWLLANAASGGNTPAALDELSSCLSEHGVNTEKTLTFPEETCPQPDQLDGAGVQLMIVYTGDGTLNAALQKLAGWSGAVLVLPGGTMNLLSKRLHGDHTAAEIIEVVAAGGARRRRIVRIAADCGAAYAGLLAGPGTHWGVVREAMRELDIVGMASGAAEAVAKSTGAGAVRVAAPPLGRREGYPLVELTPGEHGIQINGYSAATPAELAQQGWALLRRQFRDGPHDRLGLADEVTLENIDGSPVEVLLDGERCEAGPNPRFRMALSEVDLLATHHG